AMTTNETLWFRDFYPFEVLRDEIFPELDSIRTRPVRIWSTACSTGQEPYSVSIAAQEY
ncbi:MAG: chemotaxis protein, partial [Anaerolineae bacterium]|nr:chemotaxis protein [Anaerolineae bacterium]